MPFVAIPLTVKLVIHGRCDNQDVVNILHYKYVGTAPTGAQLTAFMSAWLTAHATQWYAVHGTNYSLNSLEATDLASSSGAFAVANVNGPGNTGIITGVALPNNVAIAVSWRTGLTGRRNRGRTFIGGLMSNAISGDTTQSAFAVSLANLAAALISQTFTGGFDFGVTSYKDVATKIITGFVLETILDSMRTRLPTRGS